MCMCYMMLQQRTLHLLRPRCLATGITSRHQACAKTLLASSEFGLMAGVLMHSLGVCSLIVQVLQGLQVYNQPASYSLCSQQLTQQECLLHHSILQGPLHARGRTPNSRPHNCTQT